MLGPETTKSQSFASSYRPRLTQDAGEIGHLTSCSASVLEWVKSTSKGPSGGLRLLDT